MNKSKKLMNSMDKLNQEFVDLIEQKKKKKKKSIKSQKNLEVRELNVNLRYRN